MCFKSIVLILPFFISLAYCNLKDSSKICSVIEKKSNSVKKCAFPFMYKGVKYHGCTTDINGSKDNKMPQCSTKVDPMTWQHQVTLIHLNEYINRPNTSTIKSLHTQGGIGVNQTKYQQSPLSISTKKVPNFLKTHRS